MSLVGIGDNSAGIDAAQQIAENLAERHPDLIKRQKELAGMDERKKLALGLLGKAVCFAHQPDGPAHRILAVGWNGMITLDDMAGEFAPHLFVVAKGTAA